MTLQQPQKNIIMNESLNCVIDNILNWPIELIELYRLGRMSISMHWKPAELYMNFATQHNTEKIDQLK